MVDPTRLTALLVRLAEELDQIAVLSVLPDERLDRHLSERLQRMAGFRNLLVHGYARVDDGKVREIMRVDVADLRSFRATIARAFLE